ncbi:GumC family protein [Silvibacterium dinghuense]|uniref:non-specific protein-tyrosine kinase n=1 Tax=Silvibacterium dinghuense TaxID=1560006 RepID=A0A4Q1SDL1_9BACT|nr:polysaccharide biosynthesis tyrosine autokinase [Silvibacterium dinghuense]RXS95329.1 polysaccharide biosynthesis tyrosine autokinase [Silvibacterium dinghuense]GGH12433.1 protein-tyrosine kinase [Silvibacterium dinghuense]
MNNYLLEAPPTHVEPGLTLGDLSKIIRRRRRTVYSIFGAILLLAILYCIFATRRYMATGIVQLQKDTDSGLSMSDLQNNAAAGGGDDALAANINLETQSQILQSDTLALRVIEDLNLEKNRDFQPHFNPIGWVMGLFAPKGIADPPGASLENSPARRTRLLKIFAANLKAESVSGTRLIEIDFTNSDPKVAAAVVNHLIQALTDYAFQTRVNSTSEAATWLTGQLGDLRKQSEEEQEKLAALEKQTGIYSFGTDNQGREQVYSDVLDRLQQSTAALSVASQNRILKEAVYKAVESGNAELISELGGTSTADTAPAVTNALSLIQNLRLQQANIETEIASGEKHYGSAYPHMVELRASLDKVNQAISDEVSRVQARAKSDYEIAQKTENDSRAQYEANRQAADALKDKAIDYSILREEATQSRGLYEDLLRKLKEAGVLEGLKASDITVVDPGRVPAKPKKPNVPLYLLIAAFGGLVLGLAGALIAEAMDRRIQTVEQLDRLGVPLVAILPRYSKEKRALDGIQHVRTLNAPRSAYSEAMRGLRASLTPTRTTMEPPRVVVVTSASPGEGKSLTAKNLAVSTAQQGKRVLLIDADLRKPSDKKGLEFSGKDGLSLLLTEEEQVPHILTVDGVPNLSLLPSGPVPVNPSELLSSANMGKLISDLRTRFDLILIDTPPLLPVVDALILAELADSTLLVARQASTTQDSLKRAFHLLASRTPRSSIGVVLNGVTMNSDAYHSYFGEKTSHYYMENVHETL